VVEPLILMVCFLPDETGAAVVAGAEVVNCGTGVVKPAAMDVAGTDGAGVAGVPLPVQPAASASMKTATVLRATSRYELFFGFMMFTITVNGMKYILFRQRI
jgi:hypothetical protein